MTSTHSFIGVDGGGSNTDVVIVDANGASIAEVQGPTSNMAAVGFDTATETLASLIADAVAIAGFERPATSGWLGLAGCDRPSERERMRRRFENTFDAVKVTSDVELVLAGTAEGIGIALIGGTGSIAFGRNERGDTLRSGGWGHIFGDEGSGYGLAVAGLRAVAADADGRGDSTSLTQALPDYWAVASPQQLIPVIYGPGIGKTQIAASAPVIVQEANNGDPVAIRLLEQAAADLAALVESVASRLHFDAPPDVVVTGGLLAGAKVLRTGLADRLSTAPVQQPVRLVEDIALSAARWTQSTWTKETR